MPGEHELRIALATALRERDTARDELHHVDTRLGEMCARWTEARAQLDAAKYMVEKARDCERAESERDALRAEAKRLRDVTTRLVAALDSPFVNVEATTTTAVELAEAMLQVRAALATGGGRG